MGRFQARERLAGRFVIEGWLATGGMAELYVAEMELARGMRRRVALKRVHANYAADPRFVAMFLEEARLSSGLVHPGLVPVLDVVEAEGELLMVLDYVPGWDLAAVLARARELGERLPPAAALHVLRGLAEVLAYVHAPPRSLVHRDLNPSNVLVAEDGSVRLLDFGVAKALSASAPSQTLGIKGKLAYLAPEQARQEPVDARADLYGLGLTLYELLCGRRALEADGELALLELARAPRVAPLDAAVPPDLAALTHALLAPSPADRPESAERVARRAAELEGRLGAGRVPLTGAVARWMGGSVRPLRAGPLALDLALAEAAGLPAPRPATRAQPPPPVPQASAGREPTLLLPRKKGTDARLVRVLPLGAALVAGVLALAWPRDPDPEVRRQAFLRVLSEPPGAQVLLDGAPLAEPTPLVLESPPGQVRRLELRLADHEAASSTASAEAGRTRDVRLTLPRRAGRLTLRSEPPGARIVLDGVERGQTPRVLEGLPRTRARLRLELVGHRLLEVELPFDAAAELERSFRLERVVETGLLDVSATPWARVRVDGRWVAESTPLLGHALPVGVHQVELYQPRTGRSITRRVEIKRGERASVIVRF